MRQACSVLVIEDDCETRDLLAQVLKSWGYAVVTANDGEEALSLVRRHPSPDIMLLDLLMPRMSGWEFIAEVNKNERLAAIPLVVVSGYVRAKAAFLPPAYAHLGKPLNLSRLRGLLDDLCLRDHRPH